MAEQMMAARYGSDLVNHRTYVLAGDGCLMEGISHEAASLAGHLQLSKLTLLFDDNGISIDGEVDGWFDEDVCARFKSYGWHVIENVDGHDADARVGMVAGQFCQGRGDMHYVGAMVAHENNYQYGVIRKTG